MKVKRIVIPTITMLIIASQLMGCSAATQSEMLQMLKNGDQVEIEVSAPDWMVEEQGTETQSQWIELGQLDTNTILRNGWDSILLVTKTSDGKNGIIYVTEDGQNTQNNTLYVALHNREFQKWFESQDNMDKLADAVFEQYADIEASVESADINRAVYAGVNGYFNLIPDNTANYANANSPITRAESLAMVFRANTPVGEITPDSAFAQAVGEHDLNIYAQGAQQNAYLTIEQGALTDVNYTKNISRGEFIYLIVNTYFADELASVDTKGVSLSDVKDGGDIAAAQHFDKTLNYWKAFELNYALSNPEGGAPTDMYKALVVANQLGLISSETRWDEAITKAEAVEMLCQAIMKDDAMAVFTYKLGEITGHEASVKDEDVNISEANDKDTQVADGVENEDNVEPSVKEPTSEETTTEEPTPEEPTSEEFVLDDESRQFLLDLGATEAQINAVKSPEDFVDLMNLLLYGSSGGSSGGGNSGNSGGSSGGDGEDYHDPSMETPLDPDDGSHPGHM